MVLPMKSFTIDLAFIKFVQVGSQNNTQCCINERAWTSANKICIPMVKNMTPSWTESSLVTKHGSTITSRSANGQIAEWKNPRSPIREKFKSQPSAGKLMLAVFCYPQGPILEYYQDRSSTINSVRYSEMLNLLAPELFSF